MPLDEDFMDNSKNMALDKDFKLSLSLIRITTPNLCRGPFSLHPHPSLVSIHISSFAEVSISSDGCVSVSVGHQDGVHHTVIRARHLPQMMSPPPQGLVHTLHHAGDKGRTYSYIHILIWKCFA